jgi:DNA-binding transcriptional LysR family regulator
MVSFEWYHSFIKVYRAGTVSGAAQVLNLTQPAVSQHVEALESALGHGYGFSVLPYYLCQDWVEAKRLTLILKPGRLSLTTFG